MNLQEVAGYQKALNNPAQALVKYVENGGVLDHEQNIKDAERAIIIIEGWIKATQEQYNHEEWFTGNFENSDDAKKLKKQIATFKDWIKLLKKAMADGKKAMAQQAIDKAQQNDIGIILTPFIHQDLAYFI